MKTKMSNVKLTSYDDLFSTEDLRQDAEREKIQRIPLAELQSFKNHPFKVKDDESMMQTVESVKQYGILVPAIARSKEGGGLELVSGHRRRRASELAGFTEMPVIVRNLNDDESTIVMVDSNLQRETLLPSERAFAYKMKLEALKRQGNRSDLTSGQVGTKSRTDEKVGDAIGESGRQVQRFIRLTTLVPALLDMVDEKKIAINPAVEISFLKSEEQTQLLETIESEQATPSLSQAQRLKRFSQEGSLSADVMRAIMSEEKKPEQNRLTLGTDKLQHFFPKTYTPKQMEDTILKLLEQWHKKRQQQAER
jgi:ParB-like partition proteins